MSTSANFYFTFCCIYLGLIALTFQQIRFRDITYLQDRPVVNLITTLFLHGPSGNVRWFLLSVKRFLIQEPRLLVLSEKEQKALYEYTDTLNSNVTFDYNTVSYLISGSRVNLGMPNQYRIGRSVIGLTLTVSYRNKPEHQSLVVTEVKKVSNCDIEALIGIIMLFEEFELTDYLELTKNMTSL